MVTHKHTNAGGHCDRAYNFGHKVIFYEHVIMAPKWKTKDKEKTCRTRPVDSLNENQLRFAVTNLRTMLTDKENENMELTEELEERETKMATLAKEKKKAWCIAHSLMHKQKSNPIQLTAQELQKMLKMEADLEMMSETIADKGNISTLKFE